MLPREAFAAAVRAVRQKSRLTQDELAGIDRSHLSRVERGKVDVSLQMILRISDVLGIEPAVLILLTTAQITNEPADTALKRAAHDLEALRKAGLMDLPAPESSTQPGRPAHPESEARIKRAQQLKSEGMSLAEIAHDLKVSKTTVHRYLSR